MAETTKIQWCDHSASPWHGCEHARMPDGSEHPGCANCYAERQSKRNQQVLGVWGSDGTRVKSKSFIDNLISWNKAGEKRGTPVSVFPSICDPFEDRPELVPWREEMFATIDRCPWVRLLLVTKRPENVRKMWVPFVQRDRSRPSTDFACHDSGYRPNVWLLTSVSDQQTADAMIPRLLECRDLVPVLGISAEPLLGPIHIEPWLTREYEPTADYVAFQGIDWVIVGGESGPGARPCRVQWIRSLVAQCEEASVPVFVKQLGAEAIERRVWGGGSATLKLNLRDRKGGDPAEWPEDLRMREFPEVPQ